MFIIDASIISLITIVLITFEFLIKAIINYHHNRCRNNYLN